MRKKSLIISTLTAGALLMGCNISNNTSKEDIAIVQGLVPGTLIEAFCYDGSYHKTYSINNNSSKHPFEIEIPKGVKCSFIMTTNEDSNSTKIITPILFQKDNEIGAFITLNSKTLELGYIDLPTNKDNINDNNNDLVVDDPLIVNINEASVGITPKSPNSMDKDGDGIINLYEDDDNDGIINWYDDDDDGDGIKDKQDFDHDNDGVNDADLDQDGIKNKDDVDDDNDGMYDKYDDDDDNDGIKDIDDDDDDNDGIKDKKDYDDDDDDDDDDHDDDEDDDDDDD